MSLTSFHGIIGKEKWTNVKRIIETLHKGGKFRFKVIRKQERTKSELTRDGKKRRFHIKALPKKRKLKEKKKEAEKSLGLPTFKIIGVVNFRGAIQEIDSVLGKTKGREFRRLFKKYLFEEAEHTHWYLTETSEHLVMDQKEKAILEK